MDEREHFSQGTRLLALTTLDGRYRDVVEPLADQYSEFALIRTRLEVEGAHLVKLCEVGAEKGIGRALAPHEREAILKIGPNLTLNQAVGVKNIEDTTQHDVTAMVEVFKSQLAGTSMEDLTRWVHFPCTSEDINNIAYRLMTLRARNTVMIPAAGQLIEDILTQARLHKATPMLARTHGQAAVGTTYGKELVVFADRLNSETQQLQGQKLTGKFNGAVGNMNAHHIAAPEINWDEYAKDFISSFGLIPNPTSTQINPYEDIIKMLQNYQRINGVVIDFDQDMWRYISDGWLKQIPRKTEHGSSTLTQKVNPIRFERSEGNEEMAIGVLEVMSRVLGQSRLQRDLSDSTVVRNIGLGLGFTLVTIANANEGFNRVQPDTDTMREVLNQDYSILSEAAQVIMRRMGVNDAYDLVRKATRGVSLSQLSWINFVNGLPMKYRISQFLKSLKPDQYLGNAEKVTEETIARIIAERES